MTKLFKIKVIMSLALSSITLLSLNTQNNINMQGQEAVSAEDSGIDNFDEQDGGNWYEKRILLKKAGPKRAKISKKIVTLNDLAKTFIEKQAVEEKLVKQEFLDFGFTTTYLDQQINNLSEEIEESRKKEGLNDQEKKVLDEVVKNKADLDQLKIDINTILQLDDSISKAILKLMQQLEVAKGYEQKSFELYDQIADVLDDKKAKSYYLQIETLLDNIEAIERYVNTQFATYIDSSISSVKELIEKVKNSSKILQERGVILTRQLEEAQKAEQERLAKERALKKKAVSSGWISTIKDFFMQIFNVISYPFVWLYSLIF